MKERIGSVPGIRGHPVEPRLRRRSLESCMSQRQSPWASESDCLWGKAPQKEDLIETQQWVVFKHWLRYDVWLTLTLIFPHCIMWLTIFNEDFFQFFFSARVGQVPDKKSSWFRHVFLFLIIPQLVNKISFLLASLCRPSIIFHVVDSEHLNIAPPCGFTQITHMHWDPESSQIKTHRMCTCQRDWTIAYPCSLCQSAGPSRPLPLCAGPHTHNLITGNSTSIKRHISKSSTDSKQQRLLPDLRPSLFLPNRMSTGFIGTINSLTCC